MCPSSPTTQQNAELIAAAEQAVHDQSEKVHWRFVSQMLQALEASEQRVRDLEAEVEAMETWGGLMALLDKHWPLDLIPKLPDDASRDAGPRIVSLLRWVHDLEATIAKAIEELPTHVYPTRDVGDAYIAEQVDEARAILEGSTTDHEG